MAGLISTGIWGFICSATMKAGKITATFISGATGWIIKNNGDAEFKSIYARDKIVTNEYVYNRIRVTEDEEVVTSNGKILASFLNDDGTYNVQLDLREGDINPFDANDLIQGYYHSPGNTGVIYAVQEMTVLEVLTDQTMNVVCLSESSPYKYMVIVRVGNTKNPDRQSFIRISSRTNCQYFYDQITSFIDLDNPDKVKCAIGKLDVGLIPSWAVKAVGSIKRWFGLVADGVILRGIFILQNNKTIEDEITGQVTDLAGRFEIRETGITGKWQEVIDASNSVSQSEQSVTKMVGDFQVTARHLAAEFSKTVETSTTDATGAITTATQTATSSLNRTAEQLTDSFEQSFTDANGEITQKIKTEVTQNAKRWKVEVMGSDAQGNPNTVLAAINADASGVKIKGNKVQITGTLLAQIINADGLAIGNKSICLNKDGSGYLANGGIRWDEYGNTIVDGNTILEGFSNGGYLGTKIEIISPTKYKHSVGERSCYHESLVLNVLHEEDYFVLPGNDNIWMGRILRVFNFSPDLSLNILGCTKRIPPKGVGTFLGGARVSETSQFMAWYLIGISEGIQVMGTDIY